MALPNRARVNTPMVLTWQYFTVPSLRRENLYNFYRRSAFDRLPALRFLGLNYDILFFPLFSSPCSVFSISLAPSLQTELEKMGINIQ